MSHGDGLTRLREALEEHGSAVRGTAARCPAHEDRQASLSVGQGRDGAVLNCHAGCGTDAVLEALGMSAADLFDEPREQQGRNGSGYEVAATYAYTDEHGAPLFCTERRIPKDFRQYRIENGRKVWSLGDVRRVLYRLPQVVEAVKNGQVVYVTEGEKDVHAIEAAGGVATCNPMGAGKWRGEYTAVLAGAAVVIIADRDDAGRRHAAEVATSLDGVAASVRVVQAAEGKDAADHLAARRTLAELVPMAAAEATERGEPAGLAAKYVAVDWREAWAAQPADVQWLMPGFLEAGTVNALFAKPGTGKSLLALEIAADLARRGITVVYLDDENRVADLVERLQAMGCQPGELDRLRLYSFAGLPALDTAEGGQHLEALAAADGAALVILDTTSRMVAGRENDADTFLQLYRCSLVPLKARGVTVLRLDHPGKDMAKGQRGSSAKDGDVDTVWRLEQITPVRYQLEREKSRSGHGDPVLSLRRQSEPLRHEWETAASGNDWLISKLDDLGLPRDAGRDKSRAALNEAGIKVGNDELSAAVRARKMTFRPVLSPRTGEAGSWAAEPVRDITEPIHESPVQTCPGQVTDRPDNGGRVPAGLTCPETASIDADRSGAPVPDGPPECTECGEPLDPVIAAAGETTHPGCDPRWVAAR